MSFLAPWFLLAAAAIALPVLFHRIRRATRQRTPFGSLMFLRQTPPRFTRRSRIEHWLLLALRAAALGLLALGFARPFLPGGERETPAIAPARRTVVLVDTSASMRREGLWQAAQRAAQREIDAAGPADELAVAACAHRVTPVVSFEEWKAAGLSQRASLARQRLDRVAPGWSGTHIGAALIAAAEMLGAAGSESTAPRGRIVLISDLQEGSRLGPLQGYAWPRGIELAVRPVQARRASNASLQSVAEAEAVPVADAAAVRVRVSNAADSVRDQFQVGWAAGTGTGLAAPAQDVYVPPGQSRVVALPVPADAAALDRILLTGDDEDFDNGVFVVPPEPVPFTALYLGNDTGEERGQPRFYLRRALRETRRLAVSLEARPASAGLPPGELERAGLIFVTDALDPGLAGQVRDRMLAGKTVVVVPRSANTGPTLARLLGVDALELAEVRPDRGYALLGEIDFRHPLFAAFADPRFSDFTKLHIWHYRRLAPDSVPGGRVLARLDSGDAAVVEAPAGAGRLVYLATGWHPDDSQLGLSSKFVPLLYALIEHGGGASLGPQAPLIAGEAIPLAATGGAGGPVTVHVPGGATVSLDAGAEAFDGADTPGVYRFVTARSTHRLAVNLDASESRLAVVPLEQFEVLGAPLEPPKPEVAAQAAEGVALGATEAEGRQKLWRLFLLATLAVLLIESALAGWTARHPRPAGATV